MIMLWIDPETSSGWRCGEIKSYCHPELVSGSIHQLNYLRWTGFVTPFTCLHQSPCFRFDKNLGSGLQTPTRIVGRNSARPADSKKLKVQFLIQLPVFTLDFAELVKILNFRPSGENSKKHQKTSLIVVSIQIPKPCKFSIKEQIHTTYRTITLLSDNHFRLVGNFVHLRFPFLHFFRLIFLRAFTF